MNKNKLKLRLFCIWPNRWNSASIWEKLVVLSKIYLSQNFRTAFKPNLTWIFLSVTLKLLFNFQYEIHCKSKIAQLACNVTEQNMYQAVTWQFNRIIAKYLNLLRSLVTFLQTKPKLPQFQECYWNLWLRSR